MSKATKRKHVTREVEQEFRLPSEEESIVRVVAGKGNNLHQVVDSLGSSYLVSMPTKFRKNVWIKRGDFVLVSPIPEGDKVKAEITVILYKAQIKYLKSQGAWPSEFEDSSPLPDGRTILTSKADDCEEEEEEERTTTVKLNNLQLGNSEEQEEDADDEEEEEGEEENDSCEEIFRNTNRPVYDSTSEEETSSDNED